MRPAHVIEIVTPKKYLLNGLWFGPVKSKRAVICVHGLTSSAFGMSAIVRALTSDPKLAVITFNNRGFESVADIKQKKGSVTKWKRAGSAHEVFTESLDDLQGAINFARRQGVKDIYIAGHSTGCQKSIYWASKTKGKGVKGIMLFAPISDWASNAHFDKKNTIAKALKLARNFVKAGKPHEILPGWTSPMLYDAQRYISLHTPESIEEIFTYAQPQRKPRVYNSVRTPLLVFFAGGDEYGDRPAKDILKWFERHTDSKRFTGIVVPAVNHGFKGAERDIARNIKHWISA